MCSFVSPRLTYSDIHGTPSGTFHQEVKLVQSIRNIAPRKKLREINSATVTSKCNTDQAKYVLIKLYNPCNSFSALLNTHLILCHMNLAGRKILTCSSSLRPGSRAFTGENNLLVMLILKEYMANWN